MKKIGSIVTLLLIPGFLFVFMDGIAVSESEQATKIVLRNPQVSAPVTPYVFVGDVRNLPPPKKWKPGDPIREVPKRATNGASAAEPRGFGEDPLLWDQNRAPVSINAFTTPNRNFAGGGFSGVNPPDPAGDVGPNHYIQMINSSGPTQVRIWNKATPTPSLIASFGLQSLWVGGGNCASGFGDPIVVYDRQADRWLLTEFAATGNVLCVYVSKTADPVSGGWFNYSFTTPNFPDYPKYSVWPTDANGGAGSVIITTNEGGPVVYALNRAALLAGTASTFQRFPGIPSLGGFSFQGILAPVDIDGPNGPPARATAVILNKRDTEANGPAGFPTQDFVEVWELNVDWTTPASSTLAKTANVPVAEFDSALCGLTTLSCIPQPGTAIKVDGLREPVMNRAQYINFGSHQSIVGDFAVDVNGADRAGLRWFELRGGSGGWSLFQQGTYSIDAVNRWVGGISQDISGDIGLGFSVSSSTVNPGIRYTGRLASDTTGTMSQPESVIIAGTGSNGSNRWGDYAALTLDPADDCTFWYTNMYNASSQWSTRVASFKFDTCGLNGPALYRESDSAADSCSAGGAGNGDAVLDPGEIGTLQVASHNFGNLTATGVTGTLSTSTPGITIFGDTAPFSNIAAYSTGPSIAPHFQFGIANTASCGSPIDFSLNMNSNEGSWTSNFTRKIGTPVTAAYNYTGAATPIPDPGTVNSTITVADTGPIIDVNVKIGSLSHTKDQDLDIFLISPIGTRIELTTDNGGNGDNYVNTVFDDEAITAITAGAAPFTGSFKPEGVLSAVDGQAANGVWTLEVTDDNSTNTGTLTSWSLTITRYGCKACAVTTPATEPTLTWANKTNAQWTSTAGTSWYNLYRGVPSDLPLLLNPSNDSCKRFTGSATNTGNIITEDPAPGSFYWFIVRAANPAGEGPAGNATSGPRTHNSSGSCP